MNGELQRVINVKNMLKRRYERCKSQENWKIYNANRNKVFQLGRKSLGNYIKIKCTEPSTTNGKEFWKEIKFQKQREL